VLSTGKRKMQRKRKFPRILATMVVIAATATISGISGSASATDTDYATVTGHAAFSSDANNPAFWGDNCTKVEEPGGDTYVLPAGTYTKVIVKAGAGDNANTIFAEPPTAGQTVWADTNGNNVFDPGGQDGDKTISHVILCEGTPPPPPNKTEVHGDVTFTEGSVECMRDVVLYEPPRYIVGGNVHVVYDTTRGDHAANFGQTVTVKATGVDDSSQYVLTGQTTWTHTFGPQPAPPSDCGTIVPPKSCPSGTPWKDKNHNGVVDNGECGKHHTVPPKPKCDSPKTMINGVCTTTAVAHTGLGGKGLSVEQISLAALAALLFVPFGGLGLRRVRAKIRP
jgi:hypothetical protein